MKSYEYKGYRIYNNGYGFDIYKNRFHSSELIVKDLESSDECEEYIDELFNSNAEHDNNNNYNKSVYLVVMMDGDRLGYPAKILHIVDKKLKWFLASDTSKNSQQTMLKFIDFNECRRFIELKYDSSLSAQYGILKAQLSGSNLKFNNSNLIWTQKISMK